LAIRFHQQFISPVVVVVEWVLTDNLAARVVLVAVQQVRGLKQPEMRVLHLPGAAAVVLGLMTFQQAQCLLQMQVMAVQELLLCDMHYSQLHQQLLQLHRDQQT
jgi:hypothetical protein